MYDAPVIINQRQPFYIKGFNLGLKELMVSAVLQSSGCLFQIRGSGLKCWYSDNKSLIYFGFPLSHSVIYHLTEVF